jgi:hypothetical protein
MFEVNEEVPVFRLCPRCNERGYDCMDTHSICVNCNYSPTLDPVITFGHDYGFQIPLWALEAVKNASREYTEQVTSKAKQVPQEQQAIAMGA